MKVGGEIFIWAKISKYMYIYYVNVIITNLDAEVLGGPRNTS